MRKTCLSSIGKVGGLVWFGRFGSCLEVVWKLFGSCLEVVFKEVVISLGREQQKSIFIM